MAPELRILASSTIAEYVVPSLVDSFTKKSAASEATVGVATAAQMQAFLQERLADVALGPKLTGDGSVQLESQPVMRCSLQLLTSPRSRLARARGLCPTALADVDWLVDPAGTDPSSPVFQLIGKLGVPDRRVLVLPSQTAALAAAADDDAGIAPAVTHLAAGEVRRNSVVPRRRDGIPTPDAVARLDPGQRSLVPHGLVVPPLPHDPGGDPDHARTVPGSVAGPLQSRPST